MYPPILLGASIGYRLHMPTPDRSAARIEPPVGKRCVEPSPGEAINCSWGEYLECNDVGLRFSRPDKMVGVGHPFVDVRRHHPNFDTCRSAGV